MNVVMYMAVSVDGFIAGEGDDVDWIGQESWQSYQDFVESCDAVVVGARTYEMMELEEFVEGTDYYVASKREVKLKDSKHQAINIKSVSDLPKVTKLGVIGGAKLNTFLVNIGAVNVLILDTEPVVLGRGMSLFEELKKAVRMQLIDFYTIGHNVVQSRYEIKQGDF